MSALIDLSLSDFRSYAQASLRFDGASAYFFGPNGAGKTNLLEAISFFAPGRGLRSALAAEAGRREPGEAKGRAWGVSLQLEGALGPVQIGTGLERMGSTRRIVRIDGETVAPGRLLEHLRLVWLSPAQDRLFLDGRAERLKFFDRLVFADTPSHAVQVGLYEKALKARLRLLTEGQHDPVWLEGLEKQLSAAGIEILKARQATLETLQAEIDGRGDRPFPRAVLSLLGPSDGLARGKALGDLSEGDLMAGFLASRSRDGASGRSLYGPHRCDLYVLHREKNRPAAEGSTGEQKALILNLVLAQGARLSRVNSAPNPLILLDEVAAHLDPNRRAALFDETASLGLQTFFTGTEPALFDGLKGRALGVRVEAGGLHCMGE